MLKLLVAFSALLLKIVTQFSTPSESVAYLRGLKNKKSGECFEIRVLETPLRYLYRLCGMLYVQHFIDSIDINILPHTICKTVKGYFKVIGCYDLTYRL